MKEKIKNIIESKFKYWEDYVDIFEKKSTSIEKDRETLAKKLMENPESKEIQDKVEFLYYDYNMSIQDLNQQTQELATLYSLATTLEIEVDEKIKERLESMKSGVRKQVFVADNGEYKERVKGEKDKYIKQLKDSPHYKEVIKQLKVGLENASK